ncbi:3803_t:CDS:2 [Entrophospora sp. SA101]|nr:3803_t:CDS:2 [Entrophospora sp. SA101]
MIKIGLVGLPNVGKSSLFRFLTKKEVLIANYPFATIDPNHGVMPIADFRLEKLAQVFQSAKTTPMDLICHVLRCFADSNIEHVEKSVDSLRDYEIIQSELILADLQQIEKKKQKLQILQKKQPQQAEKELKILAYLEQNLMNGFALSQLKLNAEEKGQE